MSERRVRVIAYDIVCDRRRVRLAKVLCRWAERVQDSVFEGRLTNEEVTLLLRRAQPFVKDPTDSLRVYTLCGGCADRVVCLGTGSKAEAVETVIA